MICPYNDFKECDWEKCGARMYVNDPVKKGYMMKVCAIAYNGGSLPNRLVCLMGESEKNEKRN